MASLKAQLVIQVLANKLLNKILVTRHLEQLNQIMVIQRPVIHHSLRISHKFLPHKPLVALLYQA